MALSPIRSSHSTLGAALRTYFVAIAAVLGTSLATTNGPSVAQEVQPTTPDVLQSVLSDPIIRSRYARLSEDGVEWFHNLAMVLPSLIWRPLNNDEPAKIRRRDERIELFILVRDKLSPSLETSLDTELEIVSAFVAANGGPEEAPSISLTASNYWIVFDDSSRGESQKILRLLSEKFFGGSEPATRRWLATRNGSSCTDYLAINSSSIIKSGVTLIDSSAGIDEQLKCIKVAYLRQIGINADLLLGQSPSSTQLTLEEISRLEGQLVQLLYDPHLSPGQSAVEAYPIIVREALRLIDEQSGRGGL